MAITDELRKWAQICGIKYDSKLYEIADRIDEAHRSALEKLAAQLDEGEDGWIRLPVDADGVPIHLGDKVRTEEGAYGTVDELCVSARMGWTCGIYETDESDISPRTLVHAVAPTVEDVLREFAREIDADAYGITDAKVAEFAAKLRLAGEGE